jgi:site-specific DNA-methyltransferase (cytosine-N4-specific)
MPESVTDRLSGRYENVFLFSKAQRYWFDLDPIREPHITADRPIHERDYLQRPGQWASGSGGNHRSSGPEGVGRNDLGRNPGDVWNITTQPFSAAHFAVMPAALAQRCIVAGCKPGGVVLDPFSGSGTTGLAAARLGRRYVGIDLNAEYLELSLRTRLAAAALDFEGA